MTTGHQAKHAAPGPPEDPQAGRAEPGNDGPASWATTTAQDEAAASMSGQSGSADHGWPDPGQAGPGQAGPGQAGPGQAGPGQAGPGQASEAGPGQAGPGQAGPGQASEAEPVTTQFAAVRPKVAGAAAERLAAVGAEGAAERLAAAGPGVAGGAAERLAAAGPGVPGGAAGQFAAAHRGSVQPSRVRQARRRASTLRLIWVYPDLLSTYGDRGNLLVLERRAGLRGIEVESVEVNSDQPVPRQGDIYLMGGGEDLPQILAARRLRADGGLTAATDRGAVLFAVCAGYQVIGVEFGGVDGDPVEGLGILNIRSGRGERRGVGEIVADVDPALGVPRLTGFENHQGMTSLGRGVRPLAQLILGVGNGDGTEGAYTGTVLGTYLHGPALVRNPGLADLLLSWAAGPLEPLDDADESWARLLREERLAATSS
jgi:lipid II isoglutaminyl synthase (glutamine-hydrolysing)